MEPREGGRVDKLTVVFGAAFMVVGGLLALCALGSVFTLLAWNHVVPSLFGLKEIGLTEAFALNVLASCVIKSSHTHSK